MEYEQLIELEVLKQIDKTREVSDDEVLALIDDVILNTEYDGYLGIADKIRLRSNVFNSMRGFDVLSPLLEDENVTDGNTQIEIPLYAIEWLKMGLS